MEKIDNLDKKILEIITANARIPFKDVAEECGVSRAAIHQRVQRLIDLGVIVGSGYHVDPKTLGWTPRPWATAPAPTWGSSWNAARCTSAWWKS